jgi:transcriptional regulator with XRE-family HTH domain
MTPAAALIREARARAGLTQAELGERLGMTQAGVARLERPQSNPRLSTLARVIAATGHQLKVDLGHERRHVDEAQIRERLRLTPAERLAAFQASQRAAGRLRGKARR